MKTIAVIDDDVYIGDMLEELLNREGYAVIRAYSGTEALLLLSDKRPDLILLDLMLPGMSGEEVLTKIKGIPVIVVSAKIEVQDKVNMLLGGAVDYVTKPFDTSELLARITVRLRSAAADVCRDILTFADLTLNTASHEAYVEEQKVRLTRTEFAILKKLMENPSQVMTKSQILNAVSEETPDCVEASLKVHISNLRGKLRDISGKDYIEAVWGIGFKLNEG